MKLHCDIQLPASKSESNRALMLAAYGDFEPDFQNVSDSNDTRILADAISEIKNGKRVIDIADCGTAARFLTTFLACRSGNWLLTGSERMKQRPIKPLVDALRRLGANIQYAEKEGFLPLKIEGKPLSGGKVQIGMSQSSQFASSLLLAAPMWPQGLELELIGEKASFPYLGMTLAMMRQFGADIGQSKNVVKAAHSPYKPYQFVIEADWSAASYWYEIAALSEDCEIHLRGLTLPSLQGDAVIAEWMSQLGVVTFMEKETLVLRKAPFVKRPLKFDFSAHPDLYPTLAATCAGLGVEAEFVGIDNLHLKESDRVVAMQAELAKLGQRPVHFCAHNDHRIVMALAPLAMRIGTVTFDHPEVVMKSYPKFWSDIRQQLVKISNGLTDGPFSSVFP